MASNSLTGSAVILFIGLSCLAAPPQESGQSKDLSKNGSGTPVASTAVDPAGAKPVTPANVQAVGATTPAPADAGPKDPAARDVTPGAPGKSAPASDNAAPAGRGVPDDYKIGAGDVLHIGVFHEPDASVQSVVVRTDGRISMPLLKEVSVMGMTPTQLEAKITEGLSKFLPAPDVTVVVTAINSKKIYVIGAVRREGTLSLTYPMNILQALAEMGGVTDFAKRRKIYILRNQDGKEVRIPFDYDAALRGEHMEKNVLLVAGDTIVVPGAP